MLYCNHMIQDCIIRLKNTKKNIKKSDLTIDDVTKSRVYGLCIDLINALEEAYFCFQNYDYKLRVNTINGIINTIKDLDDPEEMKEALDRLIAIMPQDYDYYDANLYEITSQAYNIITRREDIMTINISSIANLVKTSRKVNIFDPRCYQGEMLSTMAATLEADTYGMEENVECADKAKKKITKIAKGKFAGSRISNEVFDIMIQAPNVSWTFDESSKYFTKFEKDMVHDTLKYLRPSGIGIYILPYFRLYKDMCTLFARYFEDIQAIKLVGPDFEHKNLIAIIGVKKTNKDFNDEGYNLLRRVRSVQKLPEITTCDFKYHVPGAILPIETFRGSVLDFDEMASIITNSGCMDEFWNNQKVEKLSENTKQPLLPFNIGQIGLVLTSGCLDGIVEEPDKKCHVIKGRVSKKSDIQREFVDGEVVVNETINNRVEINVFLPNGDFKTLA